MQQPKIVGRPSKAVNEIGEDAINTRAVRVELLVIVRREQELERRRRNIVRRGPQVWRHAGVGEVEVQPQPVLPTPALIGGRQGALGKFLGGPVTANAEGPNKPRTGVLRGG